MSFATRLAIFFVKMYQGILSPYLGPRCRFYPSCSQYAIEALQKYGLIRGGAMVAWRLCRCGPWHPGGYDPVPDSDNNHSLRGR